MSLHLPLEHGVLTLEAFNRVQQLSMAWLMNCVLLVSYSKCVCGNYGEILVMLSEMEGTGSGN